MRDVKRHQQHFRTAHSRFGNPRVMALGPPCQGGLEPIKAYAAGAIIAGSGRTLEPCQLTFQITPPENPCCPFLCLKGADPGRYSPGRLHRPFDELWENLLRMVYHLRSNVLQRYFFPEMICGLWRPAMQLKGDVKVAWRDFFGSTHVELH